MNILKKIFLKINAFSRKMYWINNIVFPDCQKFWNLSTFDLRIVNLGSTSANHAFAYNGLAMSASNWAISPQSFIGDYAILSNYCSYLSSDAVVVISICPFSFLGGGYDDLPDKYYTIVRPISIPNASLRRRDMIMHIKNFPLLHVPAIELFGRLRELKKFFKYNKQSLEEDAEYRVKSWKKEFSIYNLHDELSLLNIDRFEDSTLALADLLTFCLDHGFKPVIVVPPISRSLRKYIDKQFQEKYINTFVEKSNTVGTTFLNYVDNSQFDDDSLFENSFILNKNGAKQFTRLFLNDLKHYNVSI